MEWELIRVAGRAELLLPMARQQRRHIPRPHLAGRVDPQRCTGFPTPSQHVIHASALLSYAAEELGQRLVQARVLRDQAFGRDWQRRQSCEADCTVSGW
jgi:hypothetical protein